ncbi:MAG: matrixin family metalloprotease [Campylobacterota bacterium]
MVIFKPILFLLLLSYSLFAGYEKVKIGKIDERYKDQLSHKQLKTLIKEIEKEFEDSLKMNIFDYDSRGKPIDILYVRPSVMEKRINRTAKRLERKKAKINRLKEYFKPKEQKLEKLTKKYQEAKTAFKDKEEEINSYIKKQNRKKDMTKQEYKKIKQVIKAKKVLLNDELLDLNELNREIRKLTLRYNNKLYSYKTHIMLYNQLARNLESMTRGFKKIKGQAVGQREIKVTKYIKDGKEVEQRTQRDTMQKIEIFGFESISELKAVLAHEIAHLVGIGHIDAKNALMNPILQKNQIEDLKLTNDDIINFKNSFNQ